MKKNKKGSLFYETPYMCLCVYVYLSVCLVCLLVGTRLYLSVCLSVYVCVCLVCLSLCNMSVCISVCMSM